MQGLDDLVSAPSHSAQPAGDVGCSGHAGCGFPRVLPFQGSMCSLQSNGRLARLVGGSKTFQETLLIRNRTAASSNACLEEEMLYSLK